MTADLRVLVVDDSATARTLLVAVLANALGVAVVGEAPGGAEGIRLAERLRPDVITMDIHMPGIDGIEATRQIMARVPTPIVIVTSANPGDVELSLEATAAGALIVLEKPVAPSTPAFVEQSARLVAMVKAMAEVKVVRRWEGPRITPTGEHRVTSRVPRFGAKIVAIAASTGGPAALKHILGRLPADFPAPVLLVQHIADGFTGGLVHWLGMDSNLEVRMAEQGESLRPGCMYVAPHRGHLTVAPAGQVVISSSAPVGGFRPSADRLFESVADVYGARAVAVILTGMGSDGVAGLEFVHRRQGFVVAQDAASSVVWGMPQQAIRRGLATAVLALPEIAPALQRLVTEEPA
jgi:two-component system, chemotaxis family, protein-glutamate methylesterase/glutaminase